MVGVIKINSMAKESFINKLIQRRIPQILGSYLVAATSLVLFIEYLVEKYQFPTHFPTLALFGIIGILPSVVILAYFHGAPGKDDWTKVEKLEFQLIFYSLGFVYYLVIILVYGKLIPIKIDMYSILEV